MKKKLDFRRAWELEISDDRLLAFIAKIDKEFPTEEHILKEFERVIWGVSGIHCINCKSTSVIRRANERRWKCEDCFRITYLTAGTAFHGMKHPRAWLILIKLLGARMNISASRFHKVVGVSASASLIIFKKVGTVIEAAYAEETTEISTAVFSRVFSKRSRETPSRKHPIAEQNSVDEHEKRELRKTRLANLRDAIEDAESDADLSNDLQTIIDIEQLKQTHLKAEDQLSETEYAIYNLITDEPIAVEKMLSHLNIEVSLLSASLSMLELGGFIRRQFGDFYIRSHSEDRVEDKGQKRKQQMQDESLEVIIASIASIHHGVSRKDFQKFFSLLLVFIDVERWDEEKLFSACAKHKVLSENTMAKEITAPSIKVPAVCFDLWRELNIY